METPFIHLKYIETDSRGDVDLGIIHELWKSYLLTIYLFSQLNGVIDKISTRRV